MDYSTLTARALDGYSSDHRPVVCGPFCQFNLGNASHADVVADLLLLRLIDGVRVIGWEEGGDRGNELAEAAERAGWQLIRDTGKPSSSHVGLLVHPDHPVKAQGLVETSPPHHWYVGHDTAGCKATGIPEAKYVLWADVEGLGVVGVTHVVPSAEKAVNATKPTGPVPTGLTAIATRDLARRQVKACADWLAAQDTDAALLGDFNLDLDSALGKDILRPLFDIATGHTAPSHGTRCIDIVWTRPAPKEKPMPETPRWDELWETADALQADAPKDSPRWRFLEDTKAGAALWSTEH